MDPRGAPILPGGGPRPRVGCCFLASPPPLVNHHLRWGGRQGWCRLVTAAYNYFHVTNFFWMFGEGCYLHTAIVLTYSTDRLRKWMFICIGWGERPAPCPDWAVLPRPRPWSGQVRVVGCAHSPPSLPGVGDSGNMSQEA